MKKGRIILAIAGLCFSTTPSFAGTGTDGADFLNIPVGAEPAALGGSYSALANNAYAPVWNPAGLGELTSPQLAAQHLSYLDTLHYEFLSFAMPLGGRDQEPASTGPSSALGGSIQYLGSGNVDGMDASGTPTGTFSSYYSAYNLSYGRSFSSKLSLGVTGKVISAKIADASAVAYGGDLGALYRYDSRWSFAATLNNIGSHLTFVDDGDSLPLAGHLSAAFHPDMQWLVTAETVFAQTGDHSFHTGLEWRPVEMLALRGGYRTDTLKELSPLAGASLGMGLNLWGQEFSYAWLPYGDLGSTHYFSLLLKFGDAEERRRNLIQYQEIKPHRSAQDNDLNGDYDQLMELLNTENRPVVGQGGTHAQP